MSGKFLSSLADRARAAVLSPPLLLRELSRRPTALFGLLVMIALVLVATFAPVFTSYGPAEQEISRRLEGPSANHLLGTDHLGRDLLSRLVYGSRVALGTALPAVLTALLVGSILGLVAGYSGGWVDNVMLVTLDTTQAFPAVILTMALLALLGPSIRNVIIVIAVTWMPGYARVTRAQVLSVKKEMFVEVERSLGASDLYLVLVHIVPNIIAPLLILLAMDLPSVITMEAGLSFLGLGVRPPTPSWGVILSDGFSKVRISPWPVVWPSLTLTITTLGFTLFGEALRDYLDPKLVGHLSRK